MELVPISKHDGATARARFFAPAHAPKAALLWTPAMGVHARSYDTFATLLAERGIATLVAENRGGESSSVKPARGVDFGYAELASDFRVYVEALRARAGETVHLGGHSMGGQLSTVLFGQHSTRDTKLVLVAAGTVHHRAWRFPDNLGIFAGTQAAGLVAAALGYFPGHRLGFGGLQSKRLIVDWARASRTGVYRTETHELELDLGALTNDVLCVQVRGDTFAPRSATERLVAKLPLAKVHWAVVEPPPEPKKVNAHFRWMRAPLDAAEAVARFLAG